MGSPLQMAPPAIDPVCGMTVNPGSAAARVEHAGTTYFFCCFAVMLVAAAPAAAQEHQHPAPAPDHAQHAAHETSLFLPREASGTAWLPDDTPMSGLHRSLGVWEVMLHGVAYAQFLYESGELHRRSHQAGSINWLMGMARRRAGTGVFGLRAMLSAEPWTIPGCGYPDLLATGETCDRDTIHDRQHPHDLFMELAAEYQRAVRGGLTWQIYAALAGEPALGPAAFPHRLSAASNPIAPIGHHWLDATHISFGVITGGIASRRWKAEASAFNGREPDERRHDLDLAAPDSFSARLSFLPSASVALQVSAGRLQDAELHEGSLPRTDVTRTTASVSYHRPVQQDRPDAAGNFWATTVAWGMNVEPASIIHRASTTHALLIESAFAPNPADTWFGRFEIAGKPGDDLHVSEAPSEMFTVAKLQFGFARDLWVQQGVRLGVGGTASGAIVSSALAPRYGGRLTPGFGVFLTLRPAAHAAGSILPQ
jgi:hypothetical protein